jgi:Arginyl-tRNA synthetase
LERKWGKKIKATKRILDLISHPLEFELIKQLIQLPDLVEEVAKNYQIQLLPNYAQKLAQSFHHFYEQCQIISSDSNLTNARMALALATKIVLKKVFDLMGVFAPEKM